MSNSKRNNLTLDFTTAKRNLGGTNLGTVLSTPDINLCKVATPELENMILNNTLGATPSAATPILFPKTVTEEQENFSAGFVDALQHLHNSNSQASDSSTVYTDLEQPQNSTTISSLPFLQHIKEEPQSVSAGMGGSGGTGSIAGGSTPPMSPVDMEYQERMKLERKRQRNRLAASKCRSRKLERISKLEDKVKNLKGDNTELATMVSQLREHVGLLKVEFMEHVNAGCQVSM